MMEQNKINKRSGRKCQDFDLAEKRFQQAQERWEIDRNDKKAWDEMFLLIQTAVFNTINKKLEHILPKEDVEERALDIACNFMQTILNKRDSGLAWKVERVSSAVYLPCRGIYKESLKFNDKIKTFCEVLYDESTQEQFLPETEESYSQDGVLCLNGIYTVPEYMTKENKGKYNINIRGLSDDDDE